MIDNKQPVTWFWKTSKSLKAIVRCWPFPTCMTKDQFRRRRHNCRRVLNYYNLTWSLISHSIIVSNKGNKNFMSSILYTRCPPATAFVSDQGGGALVPWRQAGVLSGLCWVLSGNWPSYILGSGLLRLYPSSWNLPQTCTALLRPTPSRAWFAQIHQGIAKLSHHTAHRVVWNTS